MSGDTQPPAWAAAMEERLGNDIRGRADNLERRLDATRAAIMGRIDGLQESVEHEREARTVDAGTAEMALRRNENTRGDLNTLTDMVLALSRQVRRLESEVRGQRGEGDA